MIHYLLLLLKIIGIILAILLGLLLLILALVLFVPVRYRGRVVRKPEQFFMNAKISWLLSIVNVKVKYVEKEIVYQLSILGIPFLRSDKPRNPKTRKEKIKKTKKVKKVKQPRTKENNKEQVIQTEQITQTEQNIQSEQITQIEQIPQSAQGVQSEQASSDTATKVVTVNSEKETSNQDSKATREEKKESFFTKIQNKIRKIRDTIVKTVKTIKALWAKPAAIKELLLREDSKIAVVFALGEFKRFIKHIKPTKLKGTIIYGSGDPCSTGQILGLFSILYARYGELLSITPDFEEKRFECDVTFKGRIRVITLLRSLLRLLTHKELKLLIAEFKKIGSETKN